jgi:hypothetical protein
MESRFPADCRPFVALPFILNTRTLRAVTKRFAISPHSDEQSPASGEKEREPMAGPDFQRGESMKNG